MTHEAPHLLSLSPLNLFKLVCIRAHPNNSRMLLNSKLMKIRFWKRKKKQLNIDNLLLSSHYNEIILGSFVFTNEMIQPDSEKVFSN